MDIRLLSEKAINKIAAGEVIERPISVVKELIENAIDAGAAKIEINFIRGGRTLISVTDNGVGIKKEQLNLALERHATSKITEDDIDNISFFGFRGEALASIASVGLISVTTKTAEESDAWCIAYDNSNSCQISLAKHSQGTTVSLRDLFCFTPNRVRFLKSESAEIIACTDLVRKFALCFQDIEFKLIVDDRIAVHSVPKASEEEFFNAILGENFFKDSVKIELHRGYLKIMGLIGVPTFNHPTSLKQYYFVNNRIVKDKVLATAVKYAYADLVPHNRFPAVVLFVEAQHQYVDVNVHPAKTEVRFADEQFVRKALIDAIRSSLSVGPKKQATSVFDKIVHKLHAPQNVLPVESDIQEKKWENLFSQPRSIAHSFSSAASGDTKIKASERDVDINSNRSDYQRTYNQSEVNLAAHDVAAMNFAACSSAATETADLHLDQRRESAENSLGNALYQIDNTYIVASNYDSLIIVDQHAAHERVVLEKMQNTQGALQIQQLLIPIVLKYDQRIIELLLTYEQDIRKLGIVIVRHGISEIIVAAMPAVLDISYAQTIVDQVVAHIDLFDNLDSDVDLLREIYGNIACRSSIKAGRSLSIQEMNALLREMEKTQFVEQCNHGRPTYIKITVQQLQKLFERR